MLHQITMIDDNPLDHLIVKRICDNEGLFKQMTHLNHALEFVECFTTHEYNFAQIPDVILLDLNMPEISGWDVLEILKNNYHNVGKSIDVHILSSSLSQLDLERGLQYHFVKNYLVKPMTRLKLRELHSNYCS